jgi:hypothetical protein
MTNPFEVIDARLNNIESLLLDLKHNPKQKVVESDADRWLDLNELVAYDPEKRSKQTFYSYIGQRRIPFHKKSKKLLFLKSEIDFWLKQGRKTTMAENAANADKHLEKLGGKAH